MNVSFRSLLVCICLICINVSYGRRLEGAGDDVVSKAAQYAAAAAGKFLNTPFLLKMEGYKLKGEWATGTYWRGYLIELHLRKTTCKRQEVKYEDIDCCELQYDENAFYRCNVNVRKTPKDEFSVDSINCVL